MADSSKVSTGKPLVGGAIYRGDTTVTLPTDAKASLNANFVSVGYISDAGVTNSNSMSTTDIKAWGGDVVYSAETEKPDTFKFVMIETASIEPMKAVYGDDNVTGTVETGITIKANTKEQHYKAWVIDMIMKDSILKRIVIPSAKVTALDDITYTDGDVVGYGVTLTAQPDTNGNTHYEYIVSK